MNAWLALIVLSAGVTVLRDDVNVIPAGEWRYEQFAITSKVPADVDCTFRVKDNGHARVELVTSENLQALLNGREHESIVTSTSGTLHQQIGVPGDFAIVIVNLEKKRAARVAMKVTLDTSGISMVKARYLTPQRRFVVIVSSCIGFLLIVGISARQLLVAMKR